MYLLPMDGQIASVHLLKRLTFFHLIVLALVSKISRAHFWNLNSVPLLYSSVSPPIPHYLNDCSHIVTLTLGRMIPPTLCLYLPQTLPRGRESWPVEKRRLPRLDRWRKWIPLVHSVLLLC